jgi:hypothetical protein
VNVGEGAVDMDPLAALAREAYATGWAASGGPMTDRVKAGCLAAVELAVEHAGHPGILEATLHLGHLEGVWAQVFERRDDLHTRTLADVLKAWRPIAGRLDIATTVRAVREYAGITEADDNDTANTAAAVSLALTLLRGMVGDRAWPRMREAARNAIAWAQAEGETGALALAADAAGRLGFDYDTAFRDTYTALGDRDALWGQADQWLIDVLGDSAKEVGRLLARMASDGATADEMLTAAAGLLDGADLTALNLGADLLVSRAVTGGVLDLYGRAGIDQVDFVTAGDGKVCETPCRSAEDGSPYPRDSVPRPGLHPRCRCTVTTSRRILATMYAPYLPEEGD